MTALVVFALTMFAMQTKIDFTAWGGENVKRGAQTYIRQMDVGVSSYNVTGQAR